jgi:hypothetical protein
MFKDELLALLVTAMFPVALPIVLAAKTTFKETCLPGVKVSGADIPVTVNPVPLDATLEMVTLLLPEFVSASV